MPLTKDEKRIFYEGARKAVEAVYGQREWVSEASFAHPDGFGGKVDLHSRDGEVVVDFKTKEFSPEDVDAGMKTWNNHHMQLAAYQTGLGVFPKAAICYVSVTHPGLAVCIPLTDAELTRGAAMFWPLLDYWKARNNYESGF